MKPFVGISLLFALSASTYGFAARETGEQTTAQEDNACALLVANAAAGKRLILPNGKDSPQFASLLESCRKNAKMCGSTIHELQKRGKQPPKGLACPQTATDYPNAWTCIQACERAHQGDPGALKICKARCAANQDLL